MAILTSEEQQILDAWEAEFPQEARDFAAGLHAKLGPSDDPEELIRRFQMDAPGLWLELMTALRARYSATTADVEREVGRATIEKSGAAQAAAASQAAIDAQVEAARAEGVAAGRAEVTQAQQRQNTIALIVNKLKSDCSRRLGCDATSHGIDAQRKYANFIAESVPNGFGWRENIDLIPTLVQRARDLDGTNNLIPSNTATSLVFEAEFG